MTAENVSLVLMAVFGFCFVVVAGIGLAMTAIELLRKLVGLK